MQFNIESALGVACVEATIRRAIAHAYAEQESGTQCIMVLLPTRQWVEYCATLDLHVDNSHIFVRSSDCHSSLKSLPVDALIIAPTRADGWDEEGVKLAQGQTLVSPVSTIIEITR